MNASTYDRVTQGRSGALASGIAEALRTTRKGFAPFVCAVSAGAALALALAIVPAQKAGAQEQQKALEEITVTGSRIRRQDFNANAPIVTIDEAQFQATGTIGVETIMNQLPQFVPAVTQFTTSDVQQTANNTIGGSFVSLRGLGPNRNLVLIDGKRGMPVNPQMFVDTNSIPAAAIQRVEVISGGASAVYGADAVGGVVNFILKDNYEGASVTVRMQDTFDGGGQETLVSGLIGVNAGERGNVMLGIERSSRQKLLQTDRDWRVSDAANPSAPGTAFGWGTDTWISNVQGAVGNLPSQTVVNQMFNQAQPCAIGLGLFGTPDPSGGGVCPTNAQGVNLGVPNGTNFGGTTRFLINRAPGSGGSVYTGLFDGGAGAAGSYRYVGMPAGVGATDNGDPFGRYSDLPFRVRQPNGDIKENNFWYWAEYPLDRTSIFSKGHFDLSDNVRLTGSAMFTRTQTETNLGLTADNITFWGFTVPFGSALYTGNPTYGIPSSLNANGTTNAAYLPGGRFGLNCPANGGCTKSQAFPLPPDIVTLFNSRSNPNADVWVNRPPDYLREYNGPRSGQNTTTTSQVSLGLEGNLPSGNHHWDVTFSGGYTDQLVTQTGSTRLSTYRAIAAFPNFGRNAVFDPNPFVVGFAESTPTCTSGLPVIQDFQISKDCIEMLSPDLKNRERLEQNTFEANLAGDLAQMHAGPLSYALGADYRENSYDFAPDNLSLNGNYIDPIAGLFPDAPSSGKFHVSELYGELLVPLIGKGKLIDHFNLELGGRASDWSMTEVGTIESYKALVDWGITPRYRIRGGVNRAHRAPNLGELFIARTQIFGGVSAVYQDQCSQNNQTAPFSANPAVAGATQAAQSLAICRALMGQTGAAAYYDSRPVGQQPTGVGFFGGGNGIQNSFGNPDLHEEEANTVTLGVVMSLFDHWQLSLDYYNIDVKDMIAVQSPDTTYEDCLSVTKNPTGNPLADACTHIFRNPTDGTPSNIDLSYSNLGKATVGGVDLQLNWTKMGILGGGFNINSVMNYALTQKTQDTPTAAQREWVGTVGPCALQLQCQAYEWRIFTTASYFHGPWSIQLRHQYWPSTKPGACATPIAPKATTAIYDGCQAAIITGGGVQSTYQLFALSGSWRFGDKYTLNYGIENLLDELPPKGGANPYVAQDASNYNGSAGPACPGLPGVCSTSLNASPFPVPATYGAGGLGAGAGATYDTIGRRFFLSFTMDF